MKKGEKYFLRIKSGQLWAMGEAASEAKIYINGEPCDYLRTDIVQQQEIAKQLRSFTFEFDDGSFIKSVDVQGRALFSWGVIDDELN